MKIIKPILILLLIISCGKDSSGGIDVIPQSQDNISENETTREKETNHPFLIVTKDMYNGLKEKADVEPWKSMKNDAIFRANNPLSSNHYGSLQKYVGAVALAYILDDTKREIYANKVRDVILNRFSALDIQESSSWSKVVPNLGAFFSAILALDIVYDSLSLEDIIKCEDLISERIFRVKRTGSWKTARYGTHGTWDIYKGDRTTKDDTYYYALINQITPDGVSPVTNTYAWSRVGGGDSRVSKSGYMDVLEFTGIDKRYYSNERIQKFMRWQFGSSINTAKELAIFGDMLPTESVGNSMLYRRVVNFDYEAAGYASWFLDGIEAIGHILTYIVPKEKLPPPVLPSSKIYENGGAFFRDPDDTNYGLQGVLYNITSQNEWHTHNEVNGLSLSGLGNRLLVNAGRLGEPTRAAKLNNTLTINGENHNAFTGGGITDGFTSEGIDYARGDDRDAIRFTSHYRDLILVHTTPSTPGYFIVNDKIEASNNSDIVKIYFHPSSEKEVNITEAKREYTAPIDHKPSIPLTKVTFYYLTPPNDVNIEKSISAVQDRYPGYPEHNRLESVYNLEDESLKKSISTLIFPNSNLVSKPNFEKILSDNFYGVKFYTNSSTDYIISPKIKSVEVDTFSASGDFIWCRKKSDNVNSFFVESGTSFKQNGFGFESDSPVTIYVKDSQGVIISKGAKLKLNGSNLSSASFDSSVKVISQSESHIEVELGSGTFKF